MKKVHRKEIDKIYDEIQNLMEKVYKEKKDKELYIALGQSLLALHAAKLGGIIKNFLICESW